MANTYTLIASNVLSTSQSTVTFSSIPQTFTDLILRISARTDSTNPTNLEQIRFNSDSGTNYSGTSLFSVPGSGRGSNQNQVFTAGTFNGAPTTSNTFNNYEMYLSNYAATTNRPIYIHSVGENNDTVNVLILSAANLYRGASAISSISITVPSFNFVTGSSFYLYGIKNS